MSNEIQNNCIENVEKPSVKMNWYRYITYVSLPVGVIADIILAVLLFPGVLGKFLLIIPEEARFVVAELVRIFNVDSMKIINMVFAFVFILPACYYVYVMISMAKFKKNAPRKFYFIYVISTFLSTVYFIVFFAVLTDVFGFNSEATMKIISAIIRDVFKAVIMVAINIKYFNKRKHLFVN